MAFPQKTGKGLALRSFFLVVAMFVLTWSSANSLLDVVTTCRDASNDCGSSTTDKESSEVQRESVAHWTTQPIESTTSSPDVDDSENSSTTPPSDSSTFQPDNSASEPALSKDDSSDSSYIPRSSTEESVTFTMHSEESVTLIAEESETTSPGRASSSRFQPEDTGIISLRTSRFRYEPLTCCHLARNFPFVDKLRDDPCNVIREGMGKKDAADFKAEVKQVYDSLVESVEKLNHLAEDTLRNDAPVICKDVRWYPVAKIPTHKDLQALGTKEILFLYHSSLLNHTAYLHHMYYQLHKYDRSCNRGEILLSARRLTIDVKKVTCFLRRYILAVFDEYSDESFKKPFEEILDVSLCEECVCVRRALYDCRVILSLNSILTQLATFMRELDPVRVLKPVSPASESSTDKPSDTRPSFGWTPPDSEESTTTPSSESSTDKPSDTRPSSGWATSDSKESVALSTEESTTTPPSESSNLHSEDNDGSTQTTDEIPQRRLSSCQPAKTMDFADKLRDDPCKVGGISGAITKKDISGFEPFEVKGVYDYLLAYTEVLKRTAEGALNNDMLNDCKYFKFSNITEFPTQRDLQVHSPGKILYMYYSTLINHTAHLSNMHHLLQKHDWTCSKDILRVSARQLCIQIRPVTCFLRLYMMAVYDEYNDDSFRKPSTEVLNVSLCDEGQCSRRAIYDCMVVSSLNIVVDQFAAFVEKIDPMEAKQKLEPSIQIRFKRMLNYPEW